MVTMPFDPNLHRRRSIRLPDYDYLQPGTYFVTIVCKDRVLLLTDLVFRAIVEEAWLWLADRHDYVTLDAYVIMPNHLHGVLLISNPRRGGSRTAPTQPPPHKPLGRLIGAFTTVSTKQINAMRATSGVPVWQRNYYERIIRDEDELNRVRTYIQDNPSRWEEDPENPSRSRRPRPRTEPAHVWVP